LHSGRFCIRIHKNAIKEKDYDFWVVAFHGEDDSTVFREDVQRDEIKTITAAANSHFEIWREFYPIKKLKYWVAWPYSSSKGWCTRLTGNID
jgi:hypothetical protein